MLGLVKITGIPDYIEVVTRQNIHVHPSFNPTQIVNNLALIRLPGATLGLLNSPNIGVVEMPPANETFVGQLGVVAGFGVVNDTTNFASEDLYYTFQPIVNNGLCEQAFPGLVTVNNLCANTTGSRSPCAGDFGGGLVINGTNTLAGIASFVSASGCTIGRPAVYEKIGAHLGWINGIIFNNATSTTPNPSNFTSTTTLRPTTTTGGASLAVIGNVLILLNVLLLSLFCK
jgi:secreted trypsin-like serine protease